MQTHSMICGLSEYFPARHNNVRHIPAIIASFTELMPRAQNLYTIRSSSDSSARKTSIAGLNYFPIIIPVQSGSLISRSSISLSESKPDGLVNPIN